MFLALEDHDESYFLFKLKWWYVEKESVSNFQDVFTNIFT